MKKVLIKNLSIVLCVIILIAAVPLQLSAAPEARPQAKDIPVGTLIIGTHLIHIKGLNNEILKIAQQSAQDNSQNNLYYRSEFAGGTWFDITSASGFADISTEGKPTANSVIDALVLTHWTRDDGKTVELSTGKIVDIHKIVDITDLSLLPELVELKTRKEMFETGEENDDNTNKLKSVSSIIDVPLESSEFDRLDALMSSVEGYINYLRNKKAPEDQISTVVDLKGQLYNSKLLITYTEAVNRLNREMKYAEKVITKGEDDDKKTVKAAYTDLSSAYSSCLDAVNKKVSELQNSLVKAAAPSALESERSKYEDELIKSASDGDYKTADIKLALIMSIKNILAGKVIDAAHELSILDPLVISETSSLAKNSSVVPASYTQAVDRGDTAQLINNIKKEFIASLSSQADDILSMIGYIKLRKTEPADLSEVIKQVRDKCITAISKVPAGALQKDMTDVLKKLIDALNAELAAIQGETAGNPLLDKLGDIDSAINELTDQYLSALDSGNLNQAMTLKDEINSLLAQKDEINKNASLEKNKLLEKKADLQDKLAAAMSAGDSLLIGQLLDQLAAVDANLSAQASLTDAMTSANDAILGDLFKQLSSNLDKGDYAQTLSIAKDISDMYKTTPPDGAAKVALSAIMPIVDAKLKEAKDSGRTNDAGLLQQISDILNSILEEAINNTGGGQGGDASGSGSGQDGDGSGSGSGQDGDGSGSGQGGDGSGSVSGTDLDGDDLGYGALDGTSLEYAADAHLQELLSSLGIDENSQYGMIVKIKILEEFMKLPEYKSVRSYIEQMQDQTGRQLRAMNKKLFIADHITKNKLSNVNLKAFSEATGMRLVWRTNTKEAFLTKGKIYLKFTDGSDKAADNKGKAEAMGSAAIVKGNSIYVPTIYITTRLGYSSLLLDTSGELLIYPSSIDSIVSKAMK